MGWTSGEIVSASLSKPRLVGRVVAAAPLVMASGLALDAVTQRANATSGTVMLWALGLLITGTGIGIAWPHLTVRAMNCVDDPADSSTAAAAVNTIQLVSGAFGAGLAGLVVNTATGGDVVGPVGCSRCLPRWQASVSPRPTGRRIVIAAHRVDLTTCE